MHTAASDDAMEDASSTGGATAPSESEQRSRPRQLCGTITLTKLSLPAVADVTYFAWVHDISENGIGLDLLGRLGTGVEIVFELKGSGDNEKIRLHAQVIHATPVGSFYRLGCRFTSPLRPSVLATIVGRMHGG
jgi:hypothetical protein